MKQINLFTFFLVGMPGIQLLVVNGEETSKNTTTFPIQNSEAIEIKRTFAERIAKAQEIFSDGDFLNSYIDPDKVKTYYRGVYETVVVDVGGTHLKISKVFIDSSLPKREGALSFDGAMECIPSFYRYPDTSNLQNEDKITWNDWVAERMVEFYGQDLPKKKINASLTFSYPLFQTSISNAKMERATKNFCFRIDDHTFDEDVVEALNTSLRNRNVNVHVSCVINDSTATYMAGALRGYDNIIGIVLGTGTNSSFCVKKNGTDSVTLYNSEWGSTSVPRSMLTEADLAVITDLETKKISYSIIDVLVGGCKLNDMILNSLKTLHPELYEKYIDCEEELSLAISLAIKRQNEGILKEDVDLSQTLASIINDFNARGMKILASLVSAVIESCMKDMQYVTLILNGTTFSYEDLRRALKENVKEIHPNIDIRLEFLGNASLEGAAFVSLMSSDNSNPERL
ncbi:hexokinase [Encephalitozoon intestinalis ATCC 50506]|uniref:Phosphotransferase n=1 Tax=Encephalitozoon intestinalis (strain ATCC 50506) TaxID=876142 RepID=E0SA20_ENCIT|nr:hexokinase [Encephalitozoon intestinalis ATCC 50506]ADM12642.1 hexokinase [Encephalitozoon intestinalis ATCC 50506]UTX46502.1 hexokinase [Encephalitozoon intestinalis]